MKYVVSGYIGFDNFGDEAIAHSLVNKLKNEGAEKITLISANPFRTKEIHGVDSCGMLSFIKPIMESDILISGGGSLLQDVTSIKSLIYYLTVIFTALLFKKKVIIYAQGIGPINSKFGQTLTRLILRKVSTISVRDNASKELLKSWNIDSTLVNDPVLDMDFPQSNNIGIVGIQLRSFKGITDDFITKLADEIYTNFKDKEIKILSLQDSIDIGPCENLEQKLKQKGINNVTVLKHLSINDVIENISGLEYLIAMRFHANVIGIKSKVKTLAINYDPKVFALAQTYNIPMINMDDVSFSESFKQLSSL